MSYILKIGVAEPEYRYAQRDLVKPIQSLYREDSPTRRKIAALFARSSIDYRYSALPDFGCNGKGSFYPFTGRTSCLPNVSKRMDKFKVLSAPLGQKAVESLFSQEDRFKLSQVTHLIAVSCTGISAPGLEILLAERLGLSQTVQRIAVNFMGCYAAFHGLKIADLIARSDPDALILVVCTELSTLHLRADESDDNLLSSAIFGDGAAAVLVNGQANSHPALKITGFQSMLIRDAADDMQWNVAPDGFKMNLTAMIPVHVQRHIGRFFDDILKKNGLQKGDLLHFAIHPGGKKIVEAFAASLEIDIESLDASFWVLRHFGNMSSPSVLFVLKRIWDTQLERGGHIFSAAFGPGLTIETAMLRVTG